jgi:hypothetical protein
VDEGYSDYASNTVEEGAYEVSGTVEVGEARDSAEPDFTVI